MALPFKEFNHVTLVASVCAIMMTCALNSVSSSLRALEKLKAGASTSIAVLVAEELRMHTDLAQLDSSLLALSSKHPLGAFVVTETQIQLSGALINFRAIIHVDIMSKDDVRAQSQYFGCETTANMRQWYKVARAFDNMASYEFDKGHKYTHVMRFRSDFQFAQSHVLDDIPLSKYDRLFMNTDQIFLSHRSVFQRVLCTPVVIRKYWNTHTQYYPIDIRLLFEKSASGVGKFEWLCLPEVFFSNSSQLTKIESVDELNTRIWSGQVKPQEVQCKWDGPPFAFCSERVFLLNALVQKLKPQAAFEGQLASNRHRVHARDNSETPIHNCSSF